MVAEKTHGRSGLRSAVVISLAAGLLVPVSTALAEPPATQPGAGPAAIAELVRQLGDQQYKTRVAAQQKLIELGAPAVEALTQATRSEDAEVRQRAEQALAAIREDLRRQADAAVLSGLLWKLPIRGDSAGVASPPVAVKDLVCFIALDQSVRAVDVKTGKEKWSADVKAIPHSFLAVAGEVLCAAAANDTLVAIAGASGQVKWRKELPGPAGSPVAAGGLIYAGITANKTGEHHLDAFKADTGARLWPLGSVSITNTILGRPVVAGDTLYFVTNTDWLLHAHDAASGKEKWQLKCGGRVIATPAVGDGVVYVALADRNEMSPGATLLAVNAADGKEKSSWRVAPEPPAPAQGVPNVMIMTAVDAQRITTVDGPVVLNGGLAYFGRGERLYALDLATGKEKWSFQPKAGPGTDPNVQVGAANAANGALPVLISDLTARLSSPVLANGTIYVCGKQGLHALDAKTGQELWKFPTKEPAPLPPLVAGNVAYFGTSPAASGAAVNVQMRIVLNAGGPGGAQIVMANPGPQPQAGQAGLYAVDLTKVSAPATHPAK